MPFEQHKEFKLPSRETTIWRYMDLAKLISLLDKKALYFPKLSTLTSSDPFEGLYTKPSANVHNFEFEELPKQVQGNDVFYGDKRVFDDYRSLAKDVLAFSKSLRSFVYVNCWHMNEQESAAMWSLYLKSNDGVAVQSNVQRLIDSLSHYPEEVWISKVSYLDYDRDYMPRVGPLVSKRKSFEHERELRVLIPAMKPLIKGLSDGGERLGSAIDLPDLDAGIYAAQT